MANHRALTSEQEKQALVMYNEGQSAAMIARTFEVSGTTVEKSLHRQGIEKLTRRGYRRYATAPDVIQAMVKMYEDGASCEAIAKAFNLPWERVNRRLKQAGIQLRPAGFRKGAEHHAWVGGRVVTAGGYVLVQIQLDDPFFSMSTKKDTDAHYVLEHRLVMALALGRPLTQHETVHHIDGDRANNKIDNLQLRQGRHGKGSVFRCLACGSHNIESLPIAAITQ